MYLAQVPRTPGIHLVVVAAGRGHKWLPHFSESTPETVWGHYGLTPEQAQRGGLNPKMFNSFLDGSKPSIESTAVANATGLSVPSNGLLYPPASVEDIPFVTRPTCWPLPSAASAWASCWMVKAATRCGASCCRPAPRCAWAACRWVWRTGRSSCGR